jgi:hypothetical protein
MKKHYTCLLYFISLLLSGSYASLAQQPTLQWETSLGGSAFDQPQSVQQTFDGGYIVAGISTSSNGDVSVNQGAGDVWIVKLDSGGVIEWEHSYGGSGDEGAFAIEQTADAGYIVAASSTSTNGDVTGNHGGVDFWILKINQTGFIQWETSFGGSSLEIPYAIHQTFDRGYIVTGYTISNDSNISVNHGFEDFWIVKLDSTGTLSWEKTFGGTNADRAFSILQTADSGYIACGYTNSVDGDVTNNHGDYDYWFVKMNSNGLLQWQKTFGGSLDDKAHCLDITVDGGYIVSGYTASSDSDVTFNHGFTDLWLIKLDSTATLQWEKSFGGTGVDQAYSLATNPNGNHIIAGSSYSLDGDVTGNHGGYDYWILETDTGGSLLWQNSYGGSSVEEAVCIDVTAGGDYIVAGGTLSSDGDVTFNHGDSDYWLVKLKNQITSAIANASPVNENISVSWDANNKIYHIETADQSQLEINVIDITGKTIMHNSFSFQYDWHYQQTNPGIYFISIRHKNKILLNQEVVVQK